MDSDKDIFDINVEDDDELQAINERQLLALIEKYPQLYNPHHRLYNRWERKNIIWKNIAKQLHTKPKLCKNRWHNIRNSLRRSLMNSPKICDYYLKDALKFYLPYIRTPNKEQQSSSNNKKINTTKTLRIYETKIEQPTSSSSLKSYENEILSTIENIDRGFLFSMLPDLETLDSRRKRIFKEKIVIWLRELHDDMEHERNEKNLNDHEVVVESSSNLDILCNSSDEQGNNKIIENVTSDESLVEVDTD